MTHWLAVTPGELHLARPPVGLVVCQIRHESRIAACDGAVALKIDRALDWRTCLEEHQPSYPTVGDGQTGAAASSVPAAQGWQMQSLDSEWTVTVQADHFAIETSAYPGWSEFSRRLGLLVAAVEEAIAPAIESRIGLRFVNQLEHPDVASPADWQRFIGEPLYQEKLYAAVGDDLKAVMQVVELQPSTDCRLVMRHGFRRRGSLAYILDNDCSRQGSREFSSRGIATSMQHLHDVALNAFSWGTTKDLREHYA